MNTSVNILSFNNLIFILIFIFSYLIYDYYLLLLKKRFKKINILILITLRSILLMIIIFFMINPVFINQETRNIIKLAYKLIYKSNLNLKQALDSIKSKIELSEEIKNIIKFVENSDRGLI